MWRSFFVVGLHFCLLWLFLIKFLSLIIHNFWFLFPIFSDVKSTKRRHRCCFFRYVSVIFFSRIVTRGVARLIVTASRDVTLRHIMSPVRESIWWILRFLCTRPEGWAPRTRCPSWWCRPRSSGRRSPSRRAGRRNRPEKQQRLGHVVIKLNNSRSSMCRNPT